MEELRTYCEILDDIDVMLSDGPAQNTVGGEDNVVFFTQEQLAAWLRFLASSLVKQFLHFTRVPLALVHPNVVRMLCTEPSLPALSFHGRGLFCLYLEGGTRWVDVYVDPEPLVTIRYKTSRFAQECGKGGDPS